MTTLPQGFLSQISRYPALAGLPQALLTEPAVSIRLNPAKSVMAALPEAKTDGIDRVPWCADGVYLDERPQFTFDPRLHQGVYYVQDASSMAITTAIRQISGNSPVRYLDACAAPGGKTTAALSALPHGSVVVANEYDYRRAEILNENLSKWGNANIVVSRGDTRRLGRLTEAFDIVAVDAPCSGEGMMRKDRQAIEQWSPQLIAQCADTQREILANVWQCLRPGGHLIYSTCTFNTVENEDNLDWIVNGLHGEPVPIDALDNAEGVITGLDTSYPCYRFVPGLVRGEGLFIAMVRKPGDSPVAADKAKPTRVKLQLPDEWFAQDIDTLQIGDELFALPAENASFIRGALHRLDVVSAGTHAATVKGRDLVPTHTLALSQMLEPKAFATVDIDYGQAIRYLQRDNITIPGETPRGYVLLTYRHRPLGMVKHLGNRSNTLMPKAWRILSQNVPADVPVSPLFAMPI